MLPSDKGMLRSGIAVIRSETDTIPSDIDKTVAVVSWFRNEMDTIRTETDMTASNMSMTVPVQGISVCNIDTIDGEIDMFLRIVSIPAKNTD